MKAGSVMRRFGTILLLLLLWSVGVVSAQDVSGGTIEEVASSVVQIQTRTSTGTGTIVSPDGLIYTNNHVVEDANDFEIYMIGSDLGELPTLRYYASLVYASPDLDFAVLKIDRSANGSPVNAASQQLPYLPPVHSNPVTIGDPIRSFGYPGTGDGYLISTTGEIANVQNGTINGQRIPVWYRTDAEISSGNSGGLVINELGEFIGIPTWVATDDRTAGRLAGILPIAAVEQSIAGINLAERENQPTVPRNSTGAPSTLVVINQSTETICEVYISLTTARDWGENRLSGTIPPGAQFPASIDGGMYDTLLRSCDGDILEDFRNIPVTGMTLFTYSVNGSTFDTTEPPATTPSGRNTPFTLINSSSDIICYVYISPVTSRDWGEDQLGDTEVIGRGSSRTWNLPTGEYDILLLDCNGDELADQRNIDIGQTSTLTYR